MSPLRYDPEYQTFLDANPKGPAPTFESVAELRPFSEEAMAASFRLEPTPEHIKQTRTELTGPGGLAYAITRFYALEHTQQPRPGRPGRPAVYFLHGGGMISGSVEVFAPMIARHVAQSGVQFFAVDYPLAPEHPAPAAVECAFAGLQWLSGAASQYNIDPARIAVMGDSAGGGLAAGLAIMARDRGLQPPLAKQILLYPMLDDRTDYPVDWPAREFLIWSVEFNVLAWNAYVGADKRGRPGSGISPYAAPARVPTVEGLPPAFIETPGLDLFRDENIAYAARLAEANIEVEFHLYPGLAHGYDGLIGVSQATSARAIRIRTIQSI